ncbi:GLUG motif-containing protein [Alistipes sp.]|uniref:GLUG motif-containing protein n=1 Tax=Alistipes sp. TaxID=1872444 RepID=UPI003AF41313
MRKSLLYPAYLLLGASMLLAASCDIEDVEADDGAIVFELYDTQGTLVEGLQSMKFGTTTAYTLKSAFVTYTEITAPTGWKCSVIPSSRSCTVTAPVAADLEAKPGGEITVAIQSQAGRTMIYTLAVAALEENIKLTFEGDATTKRRVYSFGKSITYNFECENTASLEVEAPEGWKYQVDTDAGTLTVTAPEKGTADPVLTGDVKVTPLSVRGTAGASSSIPVELSTRMPVISFAEQAYKFTFGEQRDIACTISNVAKCDITAPKGWTVALDIENSLLKVTAPAADADCDGTGIVGMNATSDEELTAEFTLPIAWKGISTADEFVAFGQAVTDGTPLDDYTNDGRIVLAGDIDLSAYDQNIFAGSAQKPFSGTFDGLGHTIRVNFTAKQAEVGLFHTLAAEAAVRNLVLEGSLSWTMSDARPMLGTLAVYNNGAPVSGVTTRVAVNYDNTDASTKTYSWIGGLICFSKGGVYTDCRNEGTFTMNSARYIAVGGLVGRGEDKSEGSFTNCSNTGNFELAFGELAVDSGRIGGLVGMAETAEWSFTDCTNEGAFNIDHGGTNKQFHSLGGILGNGYGTFTNCVNKGRMTMTNALAANRRMGGIVGCVGSDNGKGAMSLTMSNCRNEANLSLTTNYIGGLVGIAEKLKAGHIENCTNTGNITNPSTTSAASQAAGIIGCAYGNCTIRGCVNRGDITGLFRYRAAGILSAARSTGNLLESCENHGNLNVPTLEAATTAFPLVAGIVGVEQDYVTTIRTCKNTGSITATVKSEACANPVYIFQKAIESGTADKTDCDQASKDASAGTVMNITLKQ